MKKDIQKNPSVPKQSSEERTKILMNKYIGGTLSPEESIEFKKLTGIKLD